MKLYFILTIFLATTALGEEYRDDYYDDADIIYDAPILRPSEYPLEELVDPNFRIDPKSTISFNYGQIKYGQTPRPIEERKENVNRYFRVRKPKAKKIIYHIKLGNEKAIEDEKNVGINDKNSGGITPNSFLLELKDEIEFSEPIGFSTIAPEIKSRVSIFIPEQSSTIAISTPDKKLINNNENSDLTSEETSISTTPKIPEMSPIPKISSQADFYKEMTIQPSMRVNNKQQDRDMLTTNDSLKSKQVISQIEGNVPDQSTKLPELPIQTSTPKRNEDKVEVSAQYNATPMPFAYQRGNLRYNRRRWQRPKFVTNENQNTEPSTEKQINIAESVTNESIKPRLRFRTRLNGLQKEFPSTTTTEATKVKNIIILTDAPSQSTLTPDLPEERSIITPYNSQYNLNTSQRRRRIHRKRLQSTTVAPLQESPSFTGKEDIRPNENLEMEMTSPRQEVPSTRRNIMQTPRNSRKNSRRRFNQKQSTSQTREENFTPSVMPDLESNKKINTNTRRSRYRNRGERKFSTKAIILNDQNPEFLISSTVVPDNISLLSSGNKSTHGYDDFVNSVPEDGKQTSNEDMPNEPEQIVKEKPKGKFNKDNPPPPVPTLTPWFDGYGK